MLRAQPQKANELATRCNQAKLEIPFENLCRLVCLGLVLLSFVPSLAAQTTNGSTATPSPVVPRLMTFSGTVKDTDPRAVSSVIGVTFALYTQQTGGAPLWLETQNVQLDATGHYTVLLGSTKSEGLPIDQFISGQAQWLGVQPSGQVEEPRIMLLSVPYALKAGDAETFGGLPPSAYASVSSPSTNSTSSVTSLATVSGGSQNGGNVLLAPSPGGIPRPLIPCIGPNCGTQTTGSGIANYVPLWATAGTLKSSVIYEQNYLGSPLIDIATTARLATLAVIANSALPGLYVSSSYGTSAVIEGNDTSTAGTGSGGVSGTTSNPNGYGVSGTNASETGTGFGVQGITLAPTGAGVYGDVSGPGAVGVWGTNIAETGRAVGVSGDTNSSTGYGVQGTAFSTTGLNFGVYGVTESSGGAGTAGVNLATSGPNFGVLGENFASGAAVAGIAGANSGTAYGLEGISNSTSGDGVAGVDTAASGNANGIYGLTYSPQGVAGYFDNAGGGYVLVGIVNNAPAHVFHVDGYGDGYFAGNLDVAGMLSKGGGSFKIDHPLDPANKYLYHSFVESSDMMNIYNGNVTTDANGLATVQLPDWFQALNTDFRYQLTVMGQFAQAIVAGKVANSQFSIQTDKPSVEVSWQVTGIRQDPFANANRIQVEVDKAPADQGHYLHPELYGAPESARIRPGGVQDGSATSAQAPILPFSFVPPPPSALPAAPVGTLSVK